MPSKAVLVRTESSIVLAWSFDVRVPFVQICLCHDGEHLSAGGPQMNHSKVNSGHLTAFIRYTSKKTRPSTPYVLSRVI